jgi:hypothetical protein
MITQIENLKFMQTVIRSNDSFTDDTAVALIRIKDKINEIIEVVNNLHTCSCESCVDFKLKTMITDVKTNNKTK